MLMAYGQQPNFGDSKLERQEIIIKFRKLLIKKIIKLINYN